MKAAWAGQSVCSSSELDGSQLGPRLRSTTKGLGIQPPFKVLYHLLHGRTKGMSAPSRSQPVRLPIHATSLCAYLYCPEFTAKIYTTEGVRPVRPILKQAAEFFDRQPWVLDDATQGESIHWVRTGSCKNSFAVRHHYVLVLSHDSKAYLLEGANSTRVRDPR